MDGQRVFCLMQSVGDDLVPSFAADAGHECCVGLDAHQSVYLVVGRLTQQHDAPQWVADIAVARGLAAPGGAEHGGVSVGIGAHHRVVVVHQCGAFDVFQPQSGVGALARTALAQEHIAFFLATHDSRMEEHRVFVGCSQCEEHHQCIVDGQLQIVARGDEASS